jgi:diguanylate cyclase (GGDEF)-like protein
MASSGYYGHTVGLRVENEHMASTWLCRDDMDRERLLDMEERLKPVRRLAMGVLALVLVASGPWLGWWTLLPLAGAIAFFAIADRRLPDSRRPEYVMFAAWVGSELMIAIATALSGGPKVATLSWLAIPVITLSARFSLRGVILGVSIACSLLIAVAFGTNAAAVIDQPPLVLAPLALIIAIGVFSTALMRSDLEHRSEAVIDQLTGMLNRKALANRVAELRQQSEISGQPIGLILGDVDHFKEINDSAGHASGDAVLTDLAYVLRKQLRAFDLAYRVGGEEFLVLVPGADLRECVRLAQLLRRTVAACDFGDGERLTMSFGVSASVVGDRFDYERVFAAADEAMYEAKSLGRDRVCSAELVERPGTSSVKVHVPRAATITAS